MWGAVYPRFQPGQILPGMCRTHEADQRRKAQAETTGEMSRDTRNFANDLRKYLNQKANLTCKVMTKGLGKAELVIGEK